MLLEGKPYIIDMGQSVLIDHPNAMNYLERDIKNISRFFSKFGIKANVQNIMEYVKGGSDAEG
jgi:RIO kinase 1